MIAALYVQKDGAYSGLPDVDPWDEERDARRYREGARKNAPAPRPDTERDRTRANDHPHPGRIPRRSSQHGASRASFLRDSPYELGGKLKAA